MKKNLLPETDIYCITSEEHSRGRSNIEVEIKKFIWIPKKIKRLRIHCNIEFLKPTIEVHLLVQAKSCSPKCKFFKCAKNSAFYRRDIVWCRWTEEMCNVANCTYSLCVKRRMLPRGICGETVRRKTVEKDPEEEFGQSVRLRGKALRKIRDRELF